MSDVVGLHIDYRGQRYSDRADVWDRVVRVWGDINFERRIHQAGRYRWMVADPWSDRVDGARERRVPRWLL